MMAPEELKKAIDDGKLSIGCPLPEGFKPWTDEDKERLQQAMKRIIELEESAKAN